MGSKERRTWAAAIDGTGLPRRERAAGPYDVYLPDVLRGQTFPLDGDVAADVTDATLAVQRLDHRAAALTNTEVLARLLLRAESVASSRIEGLEISPRRLLRADIAQRESFDQRDPSAAAVLANVDAMAYALEGPGSPITPPRILEVHRRLLARTDRAAYAGALRTQQNWIGGNAFNPIGAAFVPPPPDQVPALLDDLCDFCNDDALPAVAQAAIAHVQFETIHPFVDGNGRTGRALIYMILRRRGLALRATPPISLVLATLSSEYINRMTATRVTGGPDRPDAIAAMNAWIAFFAACTSRAVHDAETFEERVREVQATWRGRLVGIRRDAAAFLLIEMLPASPIVTIGGAARAIGRSFRVTSDAVDLLLDRGVLSPVNTAHRNRVFEARELTTAFTLLERQLASPDGDTNISAPNRRVPAR